MKVLAASLPGPGHCHPMLAVCTALRARGHHVTLMSGWEHAPDAERIGASFRELPTVFGSSFAKLRPYEDTERLAHACRPLIEQTAPDVVLVDLLTFGPALAAESLGIRWASLSIHGLHTPSVDLMPFGFGRAPSRGPMRVSDMLVKRLWLRDLGRAREQVNAVRGRLGLDPVTDRLDAQLSGDLVLVATLPCLEPPRRDWPARARVVGPCLWDDPAAPEDVPDPDGDGPLVLIAASTAHGADGMLAAALEAVRACGARAVVTLGKTASPDGLPAGVVAVERARHDLLLPRCAAVICNGGHGIVARSLTHGVPVVVVPGHGDQRENGWRVERIGAGRRVAGEARAVTGALRDLLHRPSYRAAAQAAAREAATLDGPREAARALESLGAKALTRGGTVTDG